MLLTIEIVNPPESCENQGIQILLVDKKSGLISSKSNCWQVEIEQKPNRAGQVFWTGSTVQHHGDGRRFIYFAWINTTGQMFRRLKVDINDVTPETKLIQVQGTMKDGSPACATAKRVLDPKV